MVQPKLEHSELYKPCCAVLGQVCAIENKAYLDLVIEPETIKLVLSSFAKCLEICKTLSDDITLCDIFWALGNLATTEGNQIDICKQILKSHIWKNDVMNTDLRCKSKNLRFEMVNFVVKTILPFTTDIQAYHYEVEALLRDNIIP